MWYVIQVMGGQEQSTLELVLGICNQDVLENAFIPQREVMRHRAGQWITIRETLFPGYLFVLTQNPGALHERLLRIPAFARLLGGAGGFIPLTQSEIAFIESFAGEDYIIAMSEGVIEGDEIRILKGPLSDRDATIVKVDRHKRAAYVSVHMFGRDILVKLGLEIVRKGA